MDLFEIIVKRHLINTKYIVENRIEGSPHEYLKEMENLKNHTADDTLFDKACLADVVKNKVLINQNLDITDLIFDAFSTEKPLPEKLELVMDKYKRQLLKSLEDYNNIVLELVKSNDDEWFLDNKSDVKAVEKTYYRSLISTIVKARFGFQKVDYNVDLLEYEDDETSPTFEDLDFFIELLEANDQPLELDEYTYDGMNLSDKLAEIGIKKTTYYSYLKGDNVEFLRQFYIDLAIFLGFSGDYCETFLNINGLSYTLNKQHDATIYRAMFDYGLNRDYLRYMKDIQAVEQLLKPVKTTTKTVSATTEFKRNFNAQHDYFDMLKKSNLKTLKIDEIKAFTDTLVSIHQILYHWIVDHLEKDKKRLNTIETYKSQMYYDKNARKRRFRPDIPEVLEKSAKFDKLEKLVENNTRFLYYDLSRILNKSILETPWYIYQHVRIEDENIENPTLIKLLEKIEKQIRELRE